MSPKAELPRSANGELLSPGDEVYIPATVIAVGSNLTHCNLIVELKYQMPPYASKDRVTEINTKQVVRVSGSHY